MFEQEWEPYDPYPLVTHEKTCGTIYNDKRYYIFSGTRNYVYSDKNEKLGHFLMEKVPYSIQFLSKWSKNKC